ncbi:hypothetical protein ANO14919_079880 [Xylariales sp. No.14919]|nr:hypothetical protein F5X98DRAFT_259443 [Xylaria grammica]GAW18512.1 hypothetical protein ANO14919_079880 [Xylariales sp. No.14919]
MEHSLKDHHKTHASPSPVHPSTSSPVPQKRARDYGEELKGLSPSGDEGSPRDQSMLAFKRRKLGYSTGASGSDSESLDDGEIVETPSNSHVTRPVTTNPCSQATMGSEPLNTTRVLSEDGEITTSLGAKEDLSQAREVNGGKGPEESQGYENRSSTISHHPPPSLPGWNHSIQLGTRTTFKAKPASSPLQVPRAAIKPSDENREEQTKREKKRVRSRNPVSSFEASNATWNFPLDAPEVVAPENISEEEDFWSTLLKNWIVHLVRANSETADRLTYKVVRSGWSLYFTKRMGFLQGTKKHITATRVVAQNFMTSLDKDNIETMISDARQNPCATQPNDDVSATGSSLSSHDEEFRLQSKYFPGANDPSRYCLSCSGIGHSVQTCPELSCRFCESKNHRSFGCPMRRRCDKCHQTGHTVDTCQEKLSLAADELGGCIFCNADHLDQDCSEIWTTFKPSELNLRKVKSIPAFCYVCGGEKHYGPECSLAGQSDKATGRTTWSKANRDLYVDPECEGIAIAWTNFDPSQITKGEFHIPGRATRKTHTYFVSSEESEEDLIHPLVKKSVSRGEIRIASNIGTANGNSRGRGGNHKSWQPPLPPGTPPPPAEHGPRRSFQSASSGTLPPRPQPFSHGGSSGRGRGGYRSRGRGRGRGK